MFESTQRQWQTLRSSPPGERFRCYHEQRLSGRSGTLRRWLMLTAGLILAVIGLIMLPAPGPGMLVLLVAACVMARESRSAADALDRAELAGRRLWKRLQRTGDSV